MTVLTIEQAIFDSRDVTKVVRRLVVNGTSLFISKEIDIIPLLGDPAPGKAKRLCISYTFCGISMWREYSEKCGLLSENVTLGLPQIEMITNIVPNRTIFYRKILGDAWFDSISKTQKNGQQWVSNLVTRQKHLLINLDMHEDLPTIVESLKIAYVLLDIDIVGQRFIILCRERAPVKNRALVVCAYHQDPGRQFNLEFFQRHGMGYYTSSTISHTDSTPGGPDDSSADLAVASTMTVDYVLVINGPSCDAKLSPKWSKVIYRDNIGFDFAGWDEALSSCDLSQYDYFCCLNFSIRGPFTVNPSHDWLGEFTRLLNPTTKLVGLTVSTSECKVLLRQVYNPRERSVAAHVQSMFWVTDQDGYDIIRSTLALRPRGSMVAVICQQEVGISQDVLNCDYNIECILPRLHADHRLPCDQCPDSKKTKHCLWGVGYYYGGDLNPRDTIFFKSNRFPADYRPLKELTEASDARRAAAI